jgi:hypothetical protein
MNFRVGPFVYRVVRVAGYIEHGGELCLGLCDNERHELRISDQASEAQQVQIICHEYMEAWLFHFAPHLAGDVQAKEQWCDLFGLAMTQFVLDLVRTLRESGADLSFTEQAVAAPTDSGTGAPKRHRSSALRRVRATDLVDAEQWRDQVLARLADGFSAREP